MPETQEKIDVVKSRLIRDYGYDDESATDVLQLCRQYLRPRRRQARARNPHLEGLTRPLHI